MGFEFQIPLVVIAGPTASGKTQTAIDLCKQFDGEIVGADSMQVYKGMNIGTATPNAVELDGVVHHMLDIANPDEEYNAASFAKDADAVIADIHKRGKRAIVAGGTGMYMRILLKGLQAGPPPNPELRAELEEKARVSGLSSLHNMLKQLDKTSAERLHPNDGVRVIRALEVVIQTGKSLMEWQNEHGFEQLRYPHMMFGIEWERSALVERIAQRAGLMLENGFIDEVKQLLEDGYIANLKPMQGLGYKRIIHFLNGELQKDELHEKIAIDTRRYAKRQMTWFRKEDLTWLPPNSKLPSQEVSKFFTDHSK